MFTIPLPGVSRGFVNRRPYREVCGVVLSILATLALADAAKATTVGAYSAAKGRFYLTSSTDGAAKLPISIAGARKDWLPVLGAGSFKYGLYDQKTGIFHLRLEGGTGLATKTLQFEGYKKSWLPIAGDWDGDQAYGVGLYDPQSGTFYLKNQLADGPADTLARLTNAQPHWKALVGDWNGDGIATIGAYDPGTGLFHLRNTNTDGPPELNIRIQGLKQSLLPVAADWNNDGIWSPGLYNPVSHTFSWRNALNSGPREGGAELVGAQADALPVASSVSGTKPTPSATDVGAAIGVAATAVVGAAGGTLRSPDNGLLLSIPAGALAADTKIAIQAIANHAHGGKGKAYRLTPDGQIFQRPVTLTFGYSNQDLNGTAAEALGGAYQTAEGYWRWIDDPVVDAAAKIVTVATTHFTDFAFVEGLSLRPAKAKVMVNGSIDLKVVYCYPYRGPDHDNPDKVGLGMDCDDEDSDLAPLAPVSEWAVNGVAGGESELGTINATNSQEATYTAPATKPNPDTVTVSARLSIADGAALLLSHITIVDEVKAYKGVVYFEHFGSNRRPFLSAKANVTWTAFKDSVNTARNYRPTGNIVADLKYPGCDHKRVNIPIHSPKGDDPGGVLSVFPKTDPQFPRNYFFNLEGDPSFKIPLTCYYDYPEKNRPYKITLFGSSVGVGVSSCQPGSGRMQLYTDELEFLGALVCAEPQQNVFWSFEGGGGRMKLAHVNKR